MARWPSSAARWILRPSGLCSASQRRATSLTALPATVIRWVALHKPLGVVTTASDEEGRRTVLDLVRDPAGLTYVGRLDVMTTGLLLLTTDGEAVHRLA